jgi:hypothetical protein
MMRMINRVVLKRSYKSEEEEEEQGQEEAICVPLQNL